LHHTRTLHVRRDFEVSVEIEYSRVPKRSFIWPSLGLLDVGNDFAKKVTLRRTVSLYAIPFDLSM
jgi:hypothetical protein